MADRADLEAHWLRLTRETLPRLAAARGWPVVHDHCFQRILLDNACGGVWYHHVRQRPAYRHVEMDLLARAVALGEDCVAARQDLAQLNQSSLAWRRKARLAAGEGEA